MRADVDRIRGQVDAGMWTAVGLGLAFTAVNVQTFAAAGAPAWSPAWCVAWLLDPMVSVLLISVLRAEQFTARWQVLMGPRVSAVKWGAFAATYAMNTWSSWRDQLPSGVVLHSVPPLVVLLGAEVAPVLRDRLTAAVQIATAAQTPDEAASTGEHAVKPRPQPPAPDERVRALVADLTAGAEITGPGAATRFGVSERTARRLLADARAHLDTADTPAAVDLHLVDEAAGGADR